MHKVIIGAAAAAFLSATPAAPESMVVSPNGSRPTALGPAANFVGQAIVDLYYAPNEQTPQTGGHVTFSPGARSAWHSYPAGQHLIVTSGRGWIHEEGGRKREIKPGDVIWTPPGVKHWHGGTDTTSMGHATFTNMAGGKNTDWMEHVTDEQYKASAN